MGTGRRREVVPDLRAATPADAPLVLALTLAAYEEYRGVLVPESGVFRETVEQVRRHLEGRADVRGPAPGAAGPAAPAHSGGVIASVDGEAVGCARWSVQSDEAVAEAVADAERSAAEAGRSGDGKERPRAFLYVGRVAVLPAHRGHGIATALMAWCEGLARQRGLAEVRLGVRLTLSRNEAFYRRLGYRATGHVESREGYGPIAIWMSRRLDPPA